MIPLMPLPMCILKSVTSARLSLLQYLTIDFARGCSDFDSSDASRCIISFGLSDIILTTSGVPFVSVPVLSNTSSSTFASSSRDSPSFTRIPYLVKFPMAAIIAVGVARTSAHGQNTTRIVTDLLISNVARYVNTANVNAITTIIVAHLSAVLTILEFSGSDDSTNFINF